MKSINKIRYVLPIFLIVISVVGCSSSRIDWQKSNVINALPKNLSGSTVAIYPLDKQKSGKVETEVIQKHLATELAKLGVKEVNPRQDLPTYFVLFDYASELGIYTNYEQAVLIIAYASTSPPKQVYKAKLLINSSKNNMVESVNDAITTLIQSPSK